MPSGPLRGAPPQRPLYPPGQTARSWRWQPTGCPEYADCLDSGDAPLPRDHLRDSVQTCFDRRSGPRFGEKRRGRRVESTPTCRAEDAEGGHGAAEPAPQTRSRRLGRRKQRAQCVPCTEIPTEVGCIPYGLASRSQARSRGVGLGLGRPFVPMAIHQHEPTTAPGDALRTAAGALRPR